MIAMRTQTFVDFSGTLMLYCYVKEVSLGIDHRCRYSNFMHYTTLDVHIIKCMHFSFFGDILSEAFTKGRASNKDEM